MKALIIVDVQNDFTPGGALAVPDGKRVIPVINRIQHLFDAVVATKDWHPPDHGSFASNHEGKKPGEVIQLEGLEQILWPDHCVQNTEGSEFVDELDTSRVEKVFYKGTGKNIDSYSTFFDNAHRRSTGLENYLEEKGVKDVYLAGLATDYCVKFSALDSAKIGFNTFVIIDACRGINLNRGDVDKAIEEMKNAGAHIISSSDLSE